ncbi:hypothetical protein [Dactylosporangium matsuzakiense]|uniref:Uncharacterized protein n=1 Tax=Dactylosporangium matsuzakiense TaxID=53360 RepID=A0A9W6KNF4_9ACTN|nr:hypothetical protein [Dactylosporangium matsuzakiense]UWZ44648.1 hypothetical protein Dmats_46170 [Dactylosporangium matsuzakiense]GLL04658.1 hypothetical protein GCM10017581_064050 [Dactylosporangium matsuzakiense]
MFRRLWFDLHATVLHAEHALTRAEDTPTQPGARQPALVLRDGPVPLLAGNGIPMLAATPPAPATHIDTITDDTITAPTATEHTAASSRTAADTSGTPADSAADTATADAADTPSCAVRMVRLPLQVRSALTAEPLRDVLRRGAHAGHMWCTVDVDPAGLRAVTTRAVRDSAPPASAIWRDAVIAHGPQGPDQSRYRGQTCPGYQVYGAAPARFRTEVMYQVLADTLCSHRLHPVVTTVFQDGQPWLVDDLGERTPVTADVDGWWPIAHPQLRWTATLRADTGWDDPESVFGPCGADGTGLRCGVCGAVDEVTHRDLPSMAGYGFDTATTCTVCHSWDGSDPIFGARAHPKPWPPQPGAASRGVRPAGQEPVA